MKGRRWAAGALALVLLLGAGWASAQWGRSRRGVAASESSIAPPGYVWEGSKEQPEDVFTFVRLRYGSWRHSWDTDWPDADLNLSFRLQQLTSLKVQPQGKIIDVTDEQLRDYPFVYMVEPGGLDLSDAEVAALRRYLLGGGFLMADDFWGEEEWGTFYRQMKRVFPDRETQDVELDHPIFHAVFDLKEKPQMPSINVWRSTGLTYERQDAKQPHYRAIYDDKGRMMVFACHNTDLGDGWEREGEDPRYFRTFSEKQAYPMAINVIFYAMTH
jgi:hypothetical protein